MMDYDIVNRFLSRRGKVHLDDLISTVSQLKYDSREKKSNSDGEEYCFYDGQVNAYCLCLDLLENFKKRLENK
jgi:hypothetical protein